MKRQRKTAGIQPQQQTNLIVNLSDCTRTGHCSISFSCLFFCSVLFCSVLFFLKIGQIVDWHPNLRKSVPATVGDDNACLAQK